MSQLVSARSTIVAVIAVAALTILSLNLVRAVPGFWSLLNFRFVGAERYQLQTLLRPGDKNPISTLVVGDSLFQDTVWPNVSTIAGARRVVQNGFDSDDALRTYVGLHRSQGASRTFVCTVVIQISPLFMVRAREMGQGQDITMLTRDRVTDYLNPLATKRTFEVLRQWAQAAQGADPAAEPHGRLPRHVGQARFSDPTFENWTALTEMMRNFNGRTILVIDDRETDFGMGSDLVDTLDQQVAELVAAVPNVALMTLDDFIDLSNHTALDQLGCPDARLDS